MSCTYCESERPAPIIDELDDKRETGRSAWIDGGKLKVASYESVYDEAGDRDWGNIALAEDECTVRFCPVCGEALGRVAGAGASLVHIVEIDGNPLCAFLDEGDAIQFTEYVCNAEVREVPLIEMAKAGRSL